MQKMNIVYKRLDELRPYENNAKTPQNRNWPTLPTASNLTAGSSQW